MKPPTLFRRRTRGLGAAALAFTVAALGVSDVLAQAKKPNILVIWGDDIGYWNVSASYVGEFLQTFREYPPSQKPGSFSIDQAMEKLQEGGANK